MRSIHVQAHRGACAEAIENTLASFARAIAVGANSVELDVHVTKDGHLVVYHDFELNPRFTVDGNGKALSRPLPIRSLTLAELRGYDVHEATRLRVADTSTPESRRIPTLDEVFARFRQSPEARARGMIVDIEIKSDARYPEFSPPPAEFAASVVDSAKRHWSLGQTVVRSLDHRVLVEGRKIESALVIAVLTEEAVPGASDYAALGRTLRPQLMCPERTSFTRTDVEQLHAMGIRVMPYTANEPAVWDVLLALGVDGITTDDPKGLIEYLRVRGIALAGAQ